MLGVYYVDKFLKIYLVGDIKSPTFTQINKKL
jgi:hypothetical protein